MGRHMVSTEDLRYLLRITLATRGGAVQDEFLLLLMDGVLFFGGASLMSFLQLVADRLPEGQSIIRPGSHCSECKKPLTFLALIPVVGYLLIWGKCQKCQVKVPWIYPVLETVAGLAVVALVHVFFGKLGFVFEMQSLYTRAPFGVFGSNRLAWASLMGALWLFFSGIPLCIIDLRHRILPDVITLPGLLVSVALASWHPLIGWELALLGAGSGFTVLFLVSVGYRWLRKKEGMGFGDVKYIALLGAMVGPLGLPNLLLLSSILGILYAVLTGLTQKEGFQASLPFGPFLWMGGFLTFLYQNWPDH